MSLIKVNHRKNLNNLSSHKCPDFTDIVVIRFTTISPHIPIGVT